MALAPEQQRSGPLSHDRLVDKEAFSRLDESDDGKIIGEFRATGLRPYTLEKARQFGFDQAYLEACL